MKLSAIYFAGIISAYEKKVPPRHPLQRLNRLVQLSAEILNSGAFKHMPKQHDKDHSKWSRSANDKWIKMWKNKFAKNASRMERNFKRGNQRCGFYDENVLVLRLKKFNNF